MQEHTDKRKEEILNACEKLYDEFSFKEISIKLISEKTTFSRPSIYNYFETKEEIFLALFKKEYDNWNYDLTKILNSNDSLTREAFANKIAHTIEHRQRLLKLLSMNMYDLEANSRIENLIEFKKSYGNAIHILKECIIKFFPKLTEKDRVDFLYSFFPFMFGIYPYTSVTEKQTKAMKEARINFIYHSIYDLVYKCIMQLLLNVEEK